MFKSKFKWNFLHQPHHEEKNVLDILLKNRHIDSKEEMNAFFSDVPKFYDPFLFKDMKKVVERIKRAVENHEKVMIYGDYDVDGVTGTSILYKTLKQLGAQVFYYIPNRFTEGYGPNKDAFDTFVKHGFTLIITVDNGITGIDEAIYLKSIDVDFIITDHHQPKEVIPEAYAILHPHLEEDYPFHELSGCGMAFKLAHALLGRMPYEFCDLAALGTYADVVSLTGENRDLVKCGLKQLTQTEHIGLKILIKLSNIKTMDEFVLGFVLGPRINAPGRMKTGNHAVQLLVTDDYDEAYQLAVDIENLNNERKEKIEDIIDEAIELIEKNHYDEDNVIIIEKENWHEGVLGIIANRLVDVYHKPIIVLTESEGLYKGSARTLEDFPLFENLDKCSDILHKFGGHKMAAGLTIEKEHIHILRERLHDLAGDDLYNKLDIDCAIDPMDISIPFIKELQSLRPFGRDNQNPLFLFEDYEILSILQMGSSAKHLKINLKKGSQVITAIAFNKGHFFFSFNENDIVDVVGNLEINEYNNKINPQIMMKDIRCKHKQWFDYRNKPFVLSDFQNIKLQYLYFHDNYGYNNAISFAEFDKIDENIVLIDIPQTFDELKQVVLKPQLSNVYLLFKCHDIFSYEHLISREKLIKIYQILKRYKQFYRQDPKVLADLEKIGFNKNLFNIAIQVFFELNFVIIENNFIEIVESPEKRNLEESITYKNLIEYIKLKEKLLLSSTSELKQLLNQL